MLFKTYPKKYVFSSSMQQQEALKRKSLLCFTNKNNQNNDVFRYDKLQIFKCKL